MSTHLTSLPRLGGGVAVIRDGGGATVAMLSIGASGRVAPPPTAYDAATSPETGEEGFL